MKPCSSKRKSLVDHLSRANKIAEAFLNSSDYHEKIARKLKRIHSIAVDPNTIKNYMLLAVKAHDLGKALEHYQRQFDDACNPIVKNYNFIDHEVYSAAILLAKEDEIKEAYGDCELCFNSVIMAILMHHWRYSISELVDRAEDYGRKLGTIINNGLDEILGFELPTSVSGEQLSTLMSGLGKIYESSAKFYEDFLTPLVIANYAENANVFDHSKLSNLIAIINRNEIMIL